MSWVPYDMFCRTESFLADSSPRIISMGCTVDQLMANVPHHGEVPDNRFQLDSSRYIKACIPIVPDDLYDLYDLAHVAGWEPYTICLI